MTPDEQYELRRSLKRKKALHKKPSMGPNMRKPAAVSAGAGGDGASSPVRKTPPPKRKRQKKTEDEKSFARRPVPKTEAAFARWKAVRDAYNHYVAPQLKFPGKLQDFVHDNRAN